MKALRGPLAALLLSLAAFAAMAAEDDPPPTFAFVGRLLSIEPEPDPCAAKNRQSGELACLMLDSLWRARYRVLQPVAGRQADEVVEFLVADHYGFPPFARFPQALLFVSQGPDGAWLHKYQGIAVFPTRDGQWASCGQPFARRSDAPVPAPRPIAYRDDLDAGTTIDRAELRQRFEPDDYTVVDGHLRCRRGLPLPELYEGVRSGVMRARGVPLPPWTADGAS
ncbi:hypothetical protein [Pseudoxanthomonas suwonensis]|uniref:hypothetical protein n=1 Tax=Pseudoxanthomonas suwonensis TaxID=314722 RepID=UPI00069602E3|nr:hypothetical protein [Pseudoxanthomonas suwonensis]